VLSNRITIALEYYHQERLMTQHNYIKIKDAIPKSKIDKLTQKVAKSLSLDEEVAVSLVYKEWNRVEVLFGKYKKVKTVHSHFMEEIDGCYRNDVFVRE